MNKIILALRVILVQGKILILQNKLAALAAALVLGGGVAVGYFFMPNLGKGEIYDPTSTNPELEKMAQESPEDYFSQLLEKKGIQQAKEAETNPPPQTTPTNYVPQPQYSGENPFNILILGSDRRSKNGWWNVDSIIVASLFTQNKKLVLTSIPRDLWVEGARVNSALSSRGIAGFKQLITKITGLEIDRYFVTDFDGTAWAIDVMGGIDIDVERAFSDPHYPGDRMGQEGSITVSFEAGMQRMNGEQVLIYTRSRKGDNSEGSDFARSARQQKILGALPGNLMRALGESNIDKLTSLYAEAQGMVETDVSNSDLIALYSTAQNFGAYSVVNLNIVAELYNPPLSDYGGAWVLVPKTGNFQSIMDYIFSEF